MVDALVDWNERTHPVARLSGSLSSLSLSDTTNPSPTAEGLIRGIEEVEEMFAHNIVQGRLNDQGNYGAFATRGFRSKSVS